MIDHAALKAEWESSFVWRIMRRAAAAYMRDWPHAATRRIAVRTSARTTPDRAGRVRLIAATIGTAIAGYGVAAVVLPEYVVSRLPWFWFAIAAVLAFAVALRADRYVHAWPRSVTGRIVRRLMSASRPEAR